MQSPPSTAAPSDHIAPFDGLRAVAFLSVFAFHTLKVRPGWLGVDLFFALSGFLITRNLLALRRTATTTSAMAVFFYRRLLRIVPPYYLALAAMMIIDHRLAHDALWYLTFTSNVHDTLHPGVGGPALTMWSIAVEEQFYVTWPLLVLLVPRRFLPAAFLTIAAAAPACRGILEALGPDAVYRLMPSRMDSLAFGALLAAMDLRDPAWVGRHRSAAGFTALGCGGAYLAWRFAIHDFTLNYSTLAFDVIAYSLVAVGCGALVMFVRGSNEGPVHALLTNRVLRHIGKVSFIGYLIHVMVWDAVHDRHWPGPLAVSAAFVITIAIATAGWYVVERPLAGLRNHVRTQARDC